MGSSFSIINDTEHDVWVHHGINWAALIGTVAPLSLLLTAGLGPVAAGAAAGVGAGVGLAGGRALSMAEDGIITGVTAATFAGLAAAQWTLAGVVVGMSTGSLAAALGVLEAEAEKIQNKVKVFQEESTLLKPGEKYGFRGSLSLTMTMYVMNDHLQTDKRACWTGPTVGSDNEYPISEYFQNLDVKKGSEHEIPIYSK